MVCPPGSPLKWPCPLPSGPRVAVAALMASELLLDYSSLYLKDNAHLQLDTCISPVLAYRTPEVWEPSIMIIHLCPLTSKMAGFLLIPNSDNPCRPPVWFTELQPLDQKIFHRSFLDDLISISGFCLRCLIGLVIHLPNLFIKLCLATLLAPFLEDTIWIGWEVSKSSSSASFLLKLFSSSLPSCHILL